MFDRILGIANAASDYVHRMDELARLRAAARPTCGGCQHWMKSRECPREHNVNGMSRGPSMSGTPCDKFMATKDHEQAVAKYRATHPPAAPAEEPAAPFVPPVTP
jgi:hypothetical protein